MLILLFVNSVVKKKIRGSNHVHTRERVPMEKLKTAKVLLLDADGVWFTGFETRGVLPSGESLVLKSRHHHDGQGLSFLRAIGMRVVFVSGEGEPLQSIVKKLNELPSAKSGAWMPVEVFTGQLKLGDKVASIEAWFSKNTVSWSDCIYVGDDRNDVEAMKKVGLSVCPGDARRPAKRIAELVLQSSGGAGAIRELAELILDARGIDENSLPPA